MKKIVLGLMPLVVCSMLLAGCNAKKGGEESSGSGSGSEARQLPTFESAQDLIDAVGVAAWGSEGANAYNPETDSYIPQEGVVALYYSIGFTDSSADPAAATEEVLNPILDEGGDFYEMVYDLVELAQGPTFEEGAIPVSETESLNASTAWFLTGDGAWVLQASSYIYQAGSISVGVMAYANEA